MATRNDVIQELQFFSDKLSDRSRTIAAGVIATWWALLIGDHTPTPLAAKLFIGPVIWAGGASFGS
jgi:hypothetical protein